MAVEPADAGYCCFVMLMLMLMSPGSHFAIAQKHKHKHKKKDHFPFSCAYVTPVHNTLACAYVYAYVICVNHP